MELFYTLLGLAMFTAQIRAAVIMFWWHKDAPQRLRIVIGIGLLFMILAVIWLSK